jgi:hypothetical protein
MAKVVDDLGTGKGQNEDLLRRILFNHPETGPAGSVSQVDVRMPERAIERSQSPLYDLAQAGEKYDLRGLLSARDEILAQRKAELDGRNSKFASMGSALGDIAQIVGDYGKARAGAKVDLRVPESEKFRERTRVLRDQYDKMKEERAGMAVDLADRNYRRKKEEEASRQAEKEFNFRVGEANRDQKNRETAREQQLADIQSAREWANDPENIANKHWKSIFEEQKKRNDEQQKNDRTRLDQGWVNIKKRDDKDEIVMQFSAHPNDKQAYSDSFGNRVRDISVTKQQFTKAFSNALSDGSFIKSHPNYFRQVVDKDGDASGEYEIVKGMEGQIVNSYLQEKEYNSMFSVAGTPAGRPRVIKTPIGSGSSLGTTGNKNEDDLRGGMY